MTEQAAGEEDILDKPFTRGRLMRLAPHLGPQAQAVLIPELSTAPSPASWLRFVNAHLLGIGVTFLALGTAFFFAANWSALGAWTRIGLVATAIAVCGALAVRLGTHTIAGRAALGLAGLLIGPLLAVYGQAWQTGADSFALFLLWAALMTPFVVFVRWSGYFLLQVFLVEVGVSLLFGQLFGLRGVNHISLSLALAGVAAVALLGVEVVGRLRRTKGRWLARLLMVMTVFPLAPMSYAEIADHGLLRAVSESPAAALLVVLVVLGLHYRRAPKDVFALAGVGLAGTMLMAFELLHLLELPYERNTFPVFLTGLFVMVAMGFVAAWVKRHLTREDEDEDDAADRWEVAS